MNTREQILEAAWELYSDRGFEDVSVRDVTQVAGVNLASVSYHFGGIDGLIQETLKRCMNQMNRYRIELLNREVDNKGGLEKVSMRAVLGAFLRPLAMPEECAVPSALILRSVARYLIEPDYAIPRESRELYAETLGLFAKALRLHFPERSTGAMIKHLVFLSGAMTYDRGLGGLAMELSGQKSGEHQIDEGGHGHRQGEMDHGENGGSDRNLNEREQSLSDVIEFAIYGFGGNTQASHDVPLSTEI